MDRETSNCTRKYYLGIVDNDNITFKQKKQQIYNDLVVPSMQFLQELGFKMDDKKDESKDNDELRYQLRINNQKIESIKSSMFTFGRYERNDITDSEQSLSRIQCFIFIINDALFIMDGWSLCGTMTISVNGTKSNSKHSMPNKRTLLRYNKTDTIHLRVDAIDLIINPKECIICMENARVIRNSCGHYVSCKTCHDRLYATDRSLNCQLCGKPIKYHSNIPDNATIATFHSYT